MPKKTNRRKQVRAAKRKAGMEAANTHKRRRAAMVIGSPAKSHQLDTLAMAIAQLGLSRWIRGA